MKSGPECTLFPMVFVDASVIELDSNHRASDSPTGLEPAGGNGRTDSRFKVFWSAHLMTANDAVGSALAGVSAPEPCTRYPCWLSRDELQRSFSCQWPPRDA
jgi:hypothetical protein